MTTQPNPATQRPPTAAKRQFVSYRFFKLDRAFRRLPAEERQAAKDELCGILERAQDHMFIKPFSTIGTRADTDMMLWLAALQLEHITDLCAEINRSQLGFYLDSPISYLAMTRRSIYVDRHTHEGQEGTRLRIKPGQGKYLFVYPFVKTRKWYELSLPVRQAMMDKHIEAGHRYPGIRINTSYSYGLDDQEFMVSFEGDDPSDFLDLVMELRDTEASSFTERDTPIYTCISTDLGTIFEQMGA